MSLAEQINDDMKTAMRAKDKTRLASLRAVRAEIIKFTKTGESKEPSDDDVTAMVKRLIKQRQDSIDMFTKGGREDLIETEQSQINVLQTLLPEPLSADELAAVVDQAIADAGASSMKEMGNVMKAVRDLVAATGKDADNRALADLVKQKLSSEMLF
jgi:uncharacterized protein YqeY